MARALVLALVAVATAAALRSFGFSPLSAVLHTAIEASAASSPAEPRVSLETAALHRVLRADMRAPAGVQEMRDNMGLYRHGLAERTPWGANRALPALAGLAEEVPGAPVRTLRVFWPGGARPGHAIVALHGGGFVAGFPEQQLPFLERLSRRTGAVVYAPDYRLAPEHPLPAATEDAVATLRWLRDERGVPGSRLAVVGDSAGGGLVALTAQALLDDASLLPAAGVMISPWVDLTMESSRETMKEFGERDFMVRPGSDWMVEGAAGKRATNDPAVSALFGRMEGLPPLLVMASSTECLRGDATAFVERARAGGAARVDLVLPEGVDLPHTWPVLGLPESVEDTAVLAQWIVERWAERE